MKYNFQYEAVEHCVPLSLCVYGAKIYGNTLSVHARWIVHSPLSNSHTHHQHFLPGLQTAFPEDTEEAVVLRPTLPPSLSLSVFPELSTHGNNTVGSKFFCTSVSSR